jgi:hypothetical protein
MSELGKSRIVVRGSNILKPPLLETSDASIIEFYDGYNELMALLVRVLSTNAWGLVTKNDPDWNETKIRYGYMNVSKPFGEVIRTGL